MKHLALILITLNIVTCKSIDVQFTKLNQTVFLFENSDKPSVDFQITRFVPSKCGAGLKLIDGAHNVYLHYFELVNISSCLIDLNHNVTINVIFRQEITTVLDLADIGQIKLNIEYIFKFFNDSNYGLIKTDMTSNGIVSIIRLIYPKNDTIELKLTSFNKYFQIKKFLTNFYMVRLNENFNELFNEYDMVELGVEAFTSQTSILNNVLKFKIVKVDDLKIKFNSELLEFNVSIDKVKNSGFYLTKLNPQLTKSLFINSNNTDLRGVYTRSFIRLKMESTDLNMFDLDPVNGHLSILSDINFSKKFKNFKLNLVASDSRKIFKSNSIQVIVNLIDFKESELENPQTEHEIELDENKLNRYSTILSNNTNYILVFNETSIGFDYDLVSVKLNEKFKNYNLFHLEKKTGKLWLSDEIFKLNRSENVQIYNIKISVNNSGTKSKFFNLHLKIVLKTHDIFMSLKEGFSKPRIFYYEVDLDCLTQIGQLNVGHVPLKLTNGSLDIKLENFYERFFNLTLHIDGSVTLILNENYINNRQALKSLNFIETKIDYVNIEFESKSIKILIKFLNKKMYKFDQDLFEFSLGENLKNVLIGQLSSNCPNLNDYQLIGDENLDVKFKLVKNGKLIEVWNANEFDREINDKFEFDILSKCKRDEAEFLLSTKVVVHLNDLNDNGQTFVNPSQNEFVFYKNLSFLDTVEGVDYFITQIQAFDFDETEPKLKYSLNQTSLRISPNCQDLFNLRLNLNQITGELSVSNLYSESSYRHCVFDYDIKIMAFNTNNSQSIRFYIKIDLLGQDLIFQKSIIYTDTIYKIDFYDDSLEFFELNKCWLNNYDTKYLLNTFLDRSTFYFYPKIDQNQTIEYTKIECKLSSSKIDSQSLNPWLIVNFRSEKDDFFNKTTVSFDIQKDQLFFENNFLANLKNLNQPDTDLSLKLYRLSDSNEKLWNKYFKVNSLSGDLKTRIDLEGFPALIKSVNLINLKIDIQVFDMSFSNKFLYNQELSVNLNLYETKRNEMEEIVQNFDGKFINVTLSHLNETSDLRLTCFGLKKIHENELEITTQSIVEIVFDDFVLEKSEPNLNLFKIVESKNEQFLIYNSIYVSQNDIYQKFKLYLIHFKICYKITNEHDSFTRECLNFSLNVNINFEYNFNELVFSSESFYKNFILIQNSIYDQNLEQIGSNKAVIDLKQFVLGSNLIDWKQQTGLKFKSKSLRFISSSNKSSNFILSENNGLVYLREHTDLDSSFSTVITLENSNNYLSSLSINFQFLTIETYLLKNLTIRLSSEDFWVPFLDLDLTKINYAVYSQLQNEIVCENLEFNKCTSLIKFDQFTGFLALNQSQLSNLRVPNLKLITIFSLENRRLIKFNIQVNFIYETDEIKPLIESNAIHFLNTTEPNQRILILNKSKIDSNSYLDLARVKNLNTNTLVLALEYKIKTDKFDNYYLEFPYVFSMEQNQVYSFDFVVRYRENGSVSERYMKQSIYVVRMSSANLYSGPKSYFNTAGLNKFRINLTQFDEMSSQNSVFLQKIFLLDQINSNLMPKMKVENDYLDLDLTQRDRMSEIKLKIYKFLIDKLSLEIVKVTEYEILIETFDWNVKKPSVYDLIKNFHVDIRLLKSELLLKLNQNQFEVLIHEFEIANNLIEYSIDYTENLPFEIEPYGGKLFYLPTEDVKEFDLKFEKNLKFKILVTDLNGEWVEIHVNFNLIDDDPITYLGDDLKQKILVDKISNPNELIGKIDLKSAIIENNEKNFSKILNSLNANFWQLEYQAISMDTNLHLDFKTGLVFTNNLIRNEDGKILKLMAQINGKFGSKKMLVLIDVYFIFQYATLQKQSVKLEFERKNFKFNENNAKIRTIQSNKELQRFRIIHRKSDDVYCQIDQFTGLINCDFFAQVKKVYLTTLVYNYENVNSFDFAKVEISFFNQNSLAKPIANQDLTSLKYDLKHLPKIGDTVLNIYDLIKLEVDYETYRLYFIGNDLDSSSISSYFDLNIQSGDMTLRNDILTNKLNLKQYVKLVYVENDDLSDPIKTIQMFKLEIDVVLAQKFGCDSKINYENFIYYEPELLDIGRVYSKIDNLNYYLESYEFNKSISNDFNLIISELVTFTDSKNSLIIINSSNGNILLNKTKFTELKLSSVEFFVSAFKSGEYSNTFDSLYSRQKCAFQVDFKNNLTNILSYVGLRQLDLDLSVQNDQIGELVFNPRNYFLKNPKQNFQTNFELVSDQKIPFKLNPSTGDLYLSDTSTNDVFEFSIKMDSSFMFNLRIRIISNFRLNIFKQDICFKNSSSIRTKNNRVEEPRFDKEIYELNLSLDDFARNRPVLTLGVTYSNKLHFEILNRNDGLSNLFGSILKLNEFDGSIELNEYNKFLDFCQNLIPSDVNVLLNVQVYDVDNPDLYSRSVIKIRPNCDLNFINSKFIDSFYMVEISNFTRLGQYLTSVKLNQKNYDVTYSVCSSESIVSVNKKTGEVYLNKKLDKTRYDIGLCAFVTNKMIAKPIKIETRLIIVVQEFTSRRDDLRFLDKILESQAINLNLGIDTTISENLKLFQIESKNDFYLTSTSLGLFSMNSNKWINVNKKLLNEEKSYVLRIQGSTSIDLNLSFDKKELNLFISHFSKLGSKLLDLRPKFSNTYEYLVLESKQENLLSYSDGIIYLSQTPLKIDSEYEFYLKFGSIQSDFYVLKLNVKFVDIQIEDQNKPRFDLMTKFADYYFSYTRKFFDGQFSSIGKIEKGLSIKTERCLNDDRFLSGLFKVENNQILIDNDQILKFECILYELRLSNQMLVYVKIENYKEIKYLNLTSNFKQSYSSVLKTDHLQQLFYSVNVFDLINYTPDLEYDYDKTVFLSSTNKIVKDFHLNSDNGILALNLNQNGTNGTFLLNFELIFSIKYEIIKKINLKFFILNGYVSGDEVFFVNNFHHVTQSNTSLNLLEFLINPIDNSNIKTLRSSGLELKIENSEPFKFDALAGLLSTNINQQFERLIKLSACNKISRSCQTMFIALKFNPASQQSFDDIKYFFKNFKSSVTVDLNFKNFSPYLIKLKNFGNNFTAFRPNSNFIKIDAKTGLVKLNTRDDSVVKNDKFYFLIFHNNSVFAEFFVNFKPKILEYEQKNEIDVEIYGYEGEKAKISYVENLTKNPYLNCDLWRDAKVVKMNENCDLFLINNETLNSILNFQVRVYDTQYQLKSSFYDVKLNHRAFTITGQKFVIEFRIVKNSNEEILARFYQFLKSKFDFIILDHKDFGSERVFLISSTDRFDTLKQYSKLLEKSYSIKLLNVYAQDSPYEIVKTNGDDLKNLIKAKNLIVNVPDTYEILLSEETKFKNSISFTKFDYLNYEKMNFSLQKVLNFKFSFKITGENDNQFLFSSIFHSKKYLNCELVDGNVEIFHNFEDKENKISLEDKIELSEWYEIEIVINELFFVSLKKWDHVQNMFQEIDSYKKINSHFEYEIERVFVGGLPINETNFSTFKTYFSDEITISSFKINNKEILATNFVEETKEIIEKNIFKIKKNYKKYLEIEKFLFENRTREFNSLVKGFNLTICFNLLNTSTEKTELSLIKSKTSEIILNLSRRKIEFYAQNDLIASIESRTNHLENRLEIFIRPGLIKIGLNETKKEFSLSNGLNTHIFDLFFNDIIISKSNEIFYSKILINSNDISKYYDSSDVSTDQDMNNIYLIKQPKIIKNTTDTSFFNSDSAFKPGVMLITISTSMLIALLAVVSILLSIMIRKSRNQKKGSNNKLVDSKFNSRNPLEISVNSSSHSPISSSSSISDFTNSHSLGRQTIQSIMNNSNNFPRVDLQNFSRLQNYFEYESSLSQRDINSKSVNSGNFFESIINGRGTRSGQIESNHTIMNANDLDQLKSFLSWTPDIFQYSSVLNEFEKFSNTNHVCSNLNTNDKNIGTNSINNNSHSELSENNNILGSLNLYEEYDRQTFV